MLFLVTGFSNTNTIIIKFFLKYKIRGVKLLDFNDFMLIASLVNRKLHLTQEGLDQIRKIKSRMNRLRKIEEKIILEELDSDVIS